MAELAPGTRIARWMIQRKLGQGGMGAVYEAFDPQLGRPVALKFMLADDPELVKRFEREVSVAVSMHDENVAATYACFPHAGRLVMVVELLTGGTLKERVKKRGPLPWAEAARFGVGIARGLAAVHALGYVHRDLKPENVMLDAAGTPKITDFGLVRTAVGKGSIALTKTGEVVGTIEFMSPEQADGAKADARADLYSLGATLYYLVTGRPPFEGGQYQILKKVLVDTPARPSTFVAGIPPALDDLIMALLAKKPEARPNSARDVIEALEALTGKTGSGAPRRSVVPLVLGVAVVAGLGGVLLGTRPWEKAPPAPLVAPQPPQATPLPSPPPARPPVAAPEKPRRKLKTLKGEDAELPWRIRIVALTELDGRERVLAAADDTVRILDPGTGTEELCVVFDDVVRDLAAHGNLSVVGLSNQEHSSAIACDLARLEEVGRVDEHRGDVVVALSPDGKRVASAGQHDRKLISWDPEAPSVSPTVTTLVGDPSPWFVRFREGSVVVGRGGGRLEDSGHRIETHNGRPVTCGILMKGPNAGLLATVGGDGQLVVHDSSGPLASAHVVDGNRDIRALEALDDGTVVTGDFSGKCVVWKLGDRSLTPIREFKGGTGRVNSIAASGDHIVAGFDSGRVRMFDRAGNELWRWPRSVSPPALPDEEPSGEVATGHRVRGLVFTELDGALRLIHGGDDHTVHALDPKSKKEWSVDVGANVRDIAVAARAPRAFIGLTNGSVAMLELHEGATPRKFAGFDQSVCVALSPDGQRAVSVDVGENRKVVEWDLRDLRKHDGFQVDPAHNAMFIRYTDETGDRVVAGFDRADPGNHGGRLAIVNLRTQQPQVLPIPETHHNEAVTFGVRLVGQGQGWLATVGNDFHLMVHDDRGQVVAQVCVDAGRRPDWRDGEGHLFGLGVLPDGTLVTGDEDGVCRR
ncbi:MAG TPA: WD40 repeat domain-containing serine/threonine protein kinase, partial [Planctomycetota bacterium]|nr:WD40 repeat domain-containing serine/threonine protein kinase [Planctomycetota bacterium]